MVGMTDNQMAADTFAVALRRAQAEFLEMPGLQLTVAQASRLWDSDSALCTAVLSRLGSSVSWWKRGIAPSPELERRPLC